MTPDTMQNTGAEHRPDPSLPLARQLRVLLVAGGLGAALVLTSIADVTWFDAGARVSVEDLPTLPGLPPVPTSRPRPAPPPLPPLPDLPGLPPLPPLPGGVR